ncbi:MAG: hypothetical protein CBC09_06580 [Cellvibrionales bacterium TMED49]|nr:hypothetical protein [Porticoccaceae bacterium]OUU37695.1 MAG: hypothetical protein CBC09_06580 [Cellvibrionales bacterium TMED49]
MFRPLPIYIGLRYTFSGSSKDSLVSFISFLAITGLVIGVALLILVTSVMNGFERELRQKILNVVPHLVLVNKSGDFNWRSHVSELSDFDNIIEVSPYTESSGLLYSGGNTQAVRFLGISETHIPLSFSELLYESNLSVPLNDEILLSRPIADSLGVSEGDFVRFIFPRNAFKGVGLNYLKVAGIFSTHTELDQVLAIGNLEQVARVLGLQETITGLRIQIVDPFMARDLGFELLRSLPKGYGFQDWFQTHGNLYQAIQLSRNMVGLLVFLIVAIAAFNIISMLMMTVINKRREIAILQTLGVARASITCIFLAQGTLISVLGIGLGILTGCLSAIYLSDLIHLFENFAQERFLDTSVYPIDYVPVDLRALDILTIGLVAAVLNAGACLYPALRANGVAPAEELRY